MKSYANLIFDLWLSKTEKENTNNEIEIKKYLYKKYLQQKFIISFSYEKIWKNSNSSLYVFNYKEVKS